MEKKANKKIKFPKPDSRLKNGFGATDGRRHGGLPALRLIRYLLEAHGF
jgi:hypothetical protein